MEYIPGSTLDAVVHDIEGDYKVNTAHPRIQLIHRIAKAYAGLHDSGVCHLDPMPNNLLLTGDGEIKIIDFQISTCDEQSYPCRNKRGIPFMHHMIRPPESFRSGFVSKSCTDIYMLGHLFYFVFYGRFLYQEYGDQFNEPKCRDRMRQFHERIDEIELVPGHLNSVY
jgi:serine/threonine-protein kinase